MDSMTDPEALTTRLYRLFFGPARYEMKPADQAILDRGSDYRLPYAGGTLAVTTWGNSGQTVLLMHGWGGSRAQMSGLVDPLLAAGYRVVAYDQPAHGESDGTMTNILEIAPTLNLITKQEGNFHAVLAHSFGTLIISFALVHLGFPPPRKLVYFGSFNRLMDSLPRFQVLARLSDPVMEALRRRMYENLGRERLESISHNLLAPQIDIPLLMFHDTEDEVTPVEDSRIIARAWKEACFIETSGLGHRGALGSGEIHKQVIEFLDS
jgi:pimeloyl-ACP methyl ester carboxylesterase